MYIVCFTLTHSLLYFTTAYEVLSDSDKRKQYDLYGADSVNQGNAHGFNYDDFFTSGGAGGGQHFHFNFDTMFEDLFDDNDSDFFYVPASEVHHMNGMCTECIDQRARPHAHLHR